MLGTGIHLGFESECIVIAEETDRQTNGQRVRKKNWPSQKRSHFLFCVCQNRMKEGEVNNRTHFAADHRRNGDSIDDIGGS